MTRKTSVPQSRTKTEDIALQASGPNALPLEVSHSPLYGVAMLKIAMELKKADARPVDDLISGVLARMRLDETEFRKFLDSHGGLLRSVAQRRSY
jgi:hypothetical protein